MRKLYFLAIPLVLMFWSCSGSVDTTTLTAEEHFDYALGLYNDEDYERTLTELQSILLQYPASPINDDAQYYLGLSYFKRDQFLLAAYEFSKLIRDIPTSTFVGDAQYMLADSYFELSPNYQLDQAYTKKSIEEFQAFVDYFPTDSRVDEAELKISELNYKLANKAYHSARIYHKMEYYRAANKYYTKVIETYHDTEFAARAYYYRIKISLRKLQVTEAIKDMKYFISRFPEDLYIEEIEELYEKYSRFN